MPGHEDNHHTEELMTSEIEYESPNTDLAPPWELDMSEPSIKVHNLIRDLQDCDSIAR